MKHGVAHYVDFNTWSYVIFNGLVIIIKLEKLLDVYSYNTLNLMNNKHIYQYNKYIMELCVDLMDVQQNKAR